MMIKQLKLKLKAEYLIAIIIILAALLRLFHLAYPKSYVFDEVYHAFTAKEYLLNHKEAWEWWNTPPPGVAYEWTHPPLAKEVMAYSMQIFHTTDSWAYRLPGVISSLFAIYFIYLIAKKLFKDNEVIALTSAFLFSIDGLNFVQSRTGMNDIYLVTFTLISLYFFLKNRFILAAIFLGCALASKWTGLYLYGYLFVLMMITQFRDSKTRLYLIILGILAVIFAAVAKSPQLFSILNLTDLSVQAADFITNTFTPFMLQWQTHLVILVLLLIYTLVFPSFRKIGYFLIIPPLIYLFTYLPFFQLGHSYEQFTQLQQQMWWYHTGLKATHDYASKWWEWPLNLKPVWYFVEYLPDQRISNIFASGNPLLFIGGFLSILISIILLAIKALPKVINLIEKRKINLKDLDFLKGIFITTLGYLFFWLPWALSPRIMFEYHYSPAVPFMCFPLAYYLHTVYLENKYIFFTLLGLFFVSFLLIYPMLIGLPLPRNLMLLFFTTNLTKNPFGS